jgi:hypothetical protein
VENGAKLVKQNTDEDKIINLALKLGESEYRDAIWMLCDGTRIDAPKLELREPPMKVCPVRVKVLRSDGKTLYGSIVLFRKKNHHSNILLNSSFNKDDKDWWWQWKTYRPAAGARRIVDIGNGNRAQYLYSVSGGELLPSSVSPLWWNIDRFPYVSFRYKISKGTPLHIVAMGFRDRSGKREHTLAKSPMSGTEEGEERAELLLIDDGEWHQEKIDVRVIRNKYPDIDVLQSIKFEAMPRKAVNKGHGYWIDWVTIFGTRDGEL